MTNVEQDTIELKEDVSNLKEGIEKLAAMTAM